MNDNAHERYAQGPSFVPVLSKAWHVLRTQGESSSLGWGPEPRSTATSWGVVLGWWVGLMDCLHFSPAAQISMTACPWPPHRAFACLWPPRVKDIWTGSRSAPAWGPTCLRLQNRLTLPPPSQGWRTLEAFLCPQKDTAEEVTDEAWLITQW